MAEETNKAPKKGTFELTSIGHTLLPVSNFFKRHFSFIFTGAALLALVYAVLSVQLILQQTPSGLSNSATSNEYSTKFDDATIKKIDELGDRQSSATVTFPEGRINPFSE